MKLNLALLATLMICASVRAEISLASPFTDHLVLQRDRAVPIWGTAAPHERVMVAFAGQEKSGAADADGHWRVDLEALAASAESRTLVVRGSQSGAPVELHDVLVGEVWLASGQSNMDFTVSKKVKYFAGTTNEEKEIAAANYPLIRMFTGAAAKALEPQDRVAGQWLVCSPATVPAFSAVGYFFARDLQQAIHVPVGIVTLAFGASTAEAWIRRDALAGDSQLKPLLDHFDAAVAEFRAHPPAVAAPARSEDVTAKAPPGKRGRKTGPRDPVQDQHNATVLFNGMIQPVIPYAIRGVIWYQGESIVGGEAGIALYPHVQETLVRDWRQLWGEGDFPFYIVQLAGQQADSNRPEVREAQASLLQLAPNTAMAVTTDIGEAKNVHPHDKQDVGDRLARIARAKVYGEAIEYSGPVYQQMKIEDGKIRLSFTHLGGGLVVKGSGPLKWFEIAGRDSRYQPATAAIEGDSVVVSSAAVSAPVAVRYCWVNYPDGCNLFNVAGLPAGQFRTDAPKPVQPRMDDARTDVTHGLKVSSNGHYLVDAQTGAPVFLLADTAWNLGALKLEEIERYFQDRERHGFNAVMFALNFAPQASERNADGQAAYQGPDHDQLNPAYFSTCDRIVRRAADHGLFVMIYALWAGEKAGTMNRYSSAQLTALGTALGRHFAGVPNVIFCAGGEASPHYIETARVDAMGSALKAGCDGRNLVTVHPVSGSSASRFYAQSPWIDFYLAQAKSGNGPVNAAYDAAALVLGDWALPAAKPSMMGEHRYESGTAEDPLIQRRALYQCVFAGGCGYAYGHDALWQMTPHTRQPWMLKSWNPGVADWTEALDTAAVDQLQLIKRLLYSHPFLARIPDQGLVLAGQGRDVASRVQTTRDGTVGHADATYILAYLSRPGTVTLDTSVMAASILSVKWFDPATGAITPLLPRWTNAGRLTLQSIQPGQDNVAVIEAGS